MINIFTVIMLFSTIVFQPDNTSPLNKENPKKISSENEEQLGKPITSDILEKEFTEWSTKIEKK